MACRYYPRLCKMKISLFSAFSAATGFMLAGAEADTNLFVMVTGVFLLSSGACALNQYQDRHIDACMERTKSRPLPSGQIRPREALSVSVMLIMSGLAVLLGGVNLTAALFGAAGVAWYNGVYTQLKRISALAPLPGAVIGAIPPAIGWSSAGGDLSDPGMIALCVFFFIWQVPHFWFLSLSSQDDYRKAGLPTIGEVFSKGQISRIAAVWILSTAVAGLTMQLHVISSRHVLNAGLYAAGLWFIGGAVSCIISRPTALPYRSAFKRINMYMLFSMLILSAESLFFL